MKKKGLGLSTIAFLLRSVNANREMINRHAPGLEQQLIHSCVNSREDLRLNQSTAYAALIGHDNEAKPSRSQPRKGIGHTRKKGELIGMI
jgi:hypothetical protein